MTAKTSFDYFKEYCERNRLVMNKRNAKLWDAAANFGAQRGWDSRKELDVNLVMGFSAPINAGVNGDDMAIEIAEAIENRK